MGDKPRIRMLTKLIYVSDFRNTLRKKTANYVHGSPQREMLYAVMDWLDKEPIADAEPVRHGKWIENGDDDMDAGMWHCSECGHEIYSDLALIEEMQEQGYALFCEHCGAKMDKEAEK